MTRQQFRILLVASQVLLFAMYPVGALTDSMLPAEPAGPFDTEASIMEGYGGRGPAFYDDPLNLASLAVNFATLAAAVGLFYARRWGRTLYLLSFVASLFVMALTPFYLNAGLTVALGSLYGTSEGMILGLVYFSHLRRMFGRGDEDEGDADEE